MLSITITDHQDSEDCLFLNIWQPKNTTKLTSSSSLLPVMVWIHGGAFQSGTIFSTIYDGQHLAHQGQVIVVSIAYRLGPLGFLYFARDNHHHPLVPGNLGLHDQILALKWIQNNIINFGGDPTKVTIFGESAGSMSVGALLLSPLLITSQSEGRRLFHRAIMQSGAPIGRLFIQSPSEHLKVTKTFARKLDCFPIGKDYSYGDNNDDYDKVMIDCLTYNRTVERMQQVWFDAFTNGHYFNLIYGDEILPQNPAELLLEEAQNKRTSTSEINNNNNNNRTIMLEPVDLMFGVTGDEGSTFVAKILPYFNDEKHQPPMTLPSSYYEMINVMTYYDGYYDRKFAQKVAEYYSSMLYKKRKYDHHHYDHQPSQNELK